MQRSSEELLEGRIVQAAELLAKRICSFIGEGTSKVLAEFGEIYFPVSIIYLLLYPTFFPIPLANYPKKRLKKWVLSPYQFRVKTQKVRQNIDYFIEMGIDVIAITNSEKARLLNFQQSRSPTI